KPLRAGEQIRIVDAVGPALTLGAAARVVENRTQAVGVRGDRELIEQRGRERAREAERRGAVRPRPQRMEAVQVALERRVEVPGDVRAPEREAVLGAYHVVDLYRVFPQVGEMRLRQDRKSVV